MLYYNPGGQEVQKECTSFTLTWGKFIYVAREEVHVITGHETHLDYSK